MAEQVRYNVYERARQLQAEDEARLQAEEAAAAAERERTRDRTAGEFVGDVALSALGGAAGFAGAGYGLANIATGGILDRVTGFSEQFQRTQQAVGELQSAPLQARQAAVSQAFQQEGLLAGGVEALTTPSTLLDIGIQSAPYLIPGAAVPRIAARVAAAGTAARGLSTAAQASAAEQAALRAGLVTQGVVTGGYLNTDAINAARDAGLSPGAQQLAGLGAAAAGAIINPLISRVTGAAALETRAALALPGGTALPAQIGGAAARVGSLAGREAIEEGAQEASEQAITNIAGQRPVGENVGQAAVLGGILGAGLGGALGLTQIRQPSPSREEADALRRQVEAELAGADGSSPLRPSTIQQANIADAANRERLRTQLPQVDELEEIDIGATPLPIEQQVEEIDLGATPPPGLTGLNAIVAQQRALQAAQPPRPIVQELTMDQFAPAPEPTDAALPEVTELGGRTVQDVIRETAPIGRVAQQFGAAAAGQEAARRAQVQAAPEVPAAAPVDISTKPRRAQFSQRVRDEIVRSTGVDRKFIAGPDFNDLVDTLASTGAAPGTPQFAQAVGARAERLVQAREAAGKPVNFLGGVLNAYPVTPEQRQEAAIDAAFAAPEAPATPEPAPVAAQQPTPQRDLTVREVIADLGGLNISYRQDVTGDTKASSKEAVARRGRLFTQNGTSPDDLALQLAERNFIPASEVARDGGVQWTYNAINRALAGEDVYAIGSESENRQLELQAQEMQEQGEQPADAATPAAVTAAPVQYDAQKWAEYLTFPGSVQINATVDMKAGEGNPQPVLSAILFALDLSADVNEFSRVASAAQAHPELELMSQADRGLISTHMAIALNRVTGTTFELAPDGKQRQTDSAAFKNWFGDSKVVDAAGRPLVVYHGTAANFNEFDIDGSVKNALKRAIATVVPGLSAERTGELRAAFFTSSKSGASEYARNQRTAGDAPNVMPAYLSIKKPYSVDGSTRTATLPNGDVVRLTGDVSPNSLISAAKKAGADGIILRNIDDALTGETGTDIYMVFDPSQIKSAVGNVGTFDPANPDIRFRQGEAVGGINQRLFDKGVESASNNLGIPIFGFNTPADLSAQVGFPVPETTKGMFYNGQIYVVRQNIDNAKDLAFTIGHEVGHSGLARLLGPSLRAATNRMWANAILRDRIRAKMAEMNLAHGTEAERRASRSLAAEEVLADMLASGEKLNKDIWAKLRAGIREFLARAFGVRNYIVTNAEVDALLSDVAKVIQGAPAADITKTMANPQIWLIDPEGAAEADPKFSQVRADLDRVISDAQNETARVIPMHDIAKAAGQASVDAAKATASALRNNKPGELYVQNAMHLNQLANWYDKLFDGKIGQFATLKRAKEAFFNQLNSRPSKLKYNGQEVSEQSVNDVAKEWSQFGRRNPQKFEALNNMLQYSTFYKVFPDRSWNEQNDIDYAAAGYTEEERMRAHAQMVALYEAIGPQGQALYKKTQAIYEQRWKDRFEALIGELDRIGKFHLEEAKQEDGTTATIKRYKDDIRKAMQRISEGPYSPLQRNGEHLVVARDSNGDVVHFSAYDTREDAEVVRKQVAQRLRDEGETTGTVAVTRQKDFDVRVNGVSRGSIETLTRDLRSSLEGALPAGLDPAARTQLLNTLSSGLTEAYLQALPQNAFMKHARNRRNVEGFDVDAFRAFADYTLRSARDIANIKYDGQIGTALNTIQRHVDDVTAGRDRPEGEQGVQEVDADKLQTVADAVKRQHAASLEVVENKAVNALSQGAFMWFMTSPSQMFLNATQTFMVAFPRLAGIYGAGRAIRELNKAAAQYFKSGFDLLGDMSVIRAQAPTNTEEARVANVLQALYEDGTLDFTQAHDLAELSGGRNTALTPYMSKAMEVMSYAMHKSEVFNRQVTAAASVRLELDKLRQRGEQAPTPGSEADAAFQARLADVARQAIDTTHFDYSQSNKPALMQGPIGKLAFQFQQYRFHMLSMISKDIRDAELGKLVALKKPNSPEEAKAARETLAWLLGMQLAFTGTAGTILAPFVFGVADAFKDDDDLTSSRQDWINAVGKYAAHGVLAGVIDTQRIAADTLIPYLGDRAYEPVTGKPSDVLLYHISQNLGPWVGLLGDAFDGGASLMNGDVYKASQDLLPKPFRDATKSLYEGVNGAQDMRGIVYNEPSVLSGVTQFIGLRSAERRDVEADRSAVYRANKVAQGAELRYLNRVALGYANGDANAINEAMSDIQAWNQRYPDLAIKGSDIRRAVTSRVRSEQVAADTGVVMSQRPGPSIDAVLGR